MSAVLILIIVTLVCYFIRVKYKIYLTGRQICGPWALPLLGNVQVITKLKPEYLFSFITDTRTRFRKSFRLWLGPQLWVFLHSPQETRDALNDASLKRADTFQQLNVLIGNGLLISEGKYWEYHRRVLGPAFHPQVLESFAPTISRHADRFIQLSSPSLATIEATTKLFPCILDIVIATSMGKDLNSQMDDKNTYTHAFHSASELLFKRMMNPLLAPDLIFKRTRIWRQLENSLKVIHGLMESVIKQRQQFLANMSQDETNLKKCKPTLLDILLTTKIEGRSFTFQEVRDEVNTFVFAGVDTTTAAMSFVLYSLAKYPMEQNRVFAEIQNLYEAENLNISSELNVGQLNSLEYLELFIKECLRYYTIVPMTGRQTTKPTKIGDIEYCEGVTLWINMYGLAHDDELFDEPTEFMPTRFSKTHAKKEIQNFSYLPFSGGPHVCIGRKYALLILKILTVKIVKSFEINLSQPHENLILMAQMVLKSLNGINLILKKR